MARLTLPSKRATWNAILDASNLDTPPDFVAAEGRYLRWTEQYARNRGPLPAYEGGELDAVTEALDGAPVASPFHGFVLLTTGVRRWDSPRLYQAIVVLREVRGLETLRLPEWVTDLQLDRWCAERNWGREDTGVRVWRMVEASRWRKVPPRRVSGVGLPVALSPWDERFGGPRTPIAARRLRIRHQLRAVPF